MYIQALKGMYIIYIHIYILSPSGSLQNTEYMVLCYTVTLPSQVSLLTASATGDFPGSPVVKAQIPLQGWVRSLAGELRSHMPSGAAKYINK